MREYCLLNLQSAAPGWYAYLDFLSMTLDGKKVPGTILEEWDEISKETKQHNKIILDHIKNNVS